MRSNLALKQEQLESVEIRAEIFDFNQLQAIQIAVQTEAASRLPGNTGACDFEEFLSHYGHGIVSDFA